MRSIDNRSHNKYQVAGETVISRQVTVVWIYPLSSEMSDDRCLNVLMTFTLLNIYYNYKEGSIVLFTMTQRRTLTGVYKELINPMAPMTSGRPVQGRPWKRLVGRPVWKP
jgi:hypothetical protein